MGTRSLRYLSFHPAPKRHRKDGKDELFHNARWAEQFVMQGIVTAMADRLCQEDRPLTPAELCTVTESDVLTGYELTQPEKKKERRRPGFHMS